MLLNQGQFGMLDLFKGSSQAAKDRSRIGKYDKAYDVEGNLSHNDQEYTNLYYDLATDFYEYGWGRSFHFGTRYEGESFQQHIERHEHFLASKLGITEGMKVLDMGMGVGVPSATSCASPTLTSPGSPSTTTRYTRARGLEHAVSAAACRDDIHTIIHACHMSAEARSPQADVIFQRYLSTPCAPRACDSSASLRFFS